LSMQRKVPLGRNGKWKRIKFGRKGEGPTTKVKKREKFGGKPK